MDREIPKGKTDLYILSAACKWHPYAARTLPVISLLLRVCLCVRNDYMHMLLCLTCEVEE